MTHSPSSADWAEIDRLGPLAYDRYVRPNLRPEDDGKFIALDVDTGEYELDASDYVATTRLLDRRPGARVWLMCAGLPATCKILRISPRAE